MSNATTELALAISAVILAYAILTCIYQHRLIKKLRDGQRQWRELAIRNNKEGESTMTSSLTRDKARAAKGLANPTSQ